MRTIYMLIILICFIGNTMADIDHPQKPKKMTVSEAVALALKTHSSILQAQKYEQAARAARDSSRADMFAKLSGVYTYTRLKNEPFMSFMGTEKIIGDKDAIHWDISFTQPIFKGFGLINRLRQTQVGIEIKALELQETRLDIAKQTKMTYYNVLLAKDIERVANDAVTAFEAHVANAENFFNNGIIPRNDLLKANVALATAMQEQEKARANHQMTLSRFNLIIGRKIDAPTQLEHQKNITIQSNDPAVLIEQALTHRPELKRMQLVLKTAKIGIKLSQSHFYPEVALVGKYEQNGSDFNAAYNAYNNDHNVSISLQGKWTFFEWGKIRADIAKLRFELEAVKETIKGLEDQIRLETQDACLEAMVAETNITTARQALNQAKENWRITNLQYQQHVTTSTDVLDARTFLRESETNYYKALYGYMMALAKLQRAVGTKI